MSKAQKRQFLSEPYALDQSHIPGAPIATIESQTIGASALGSPSDAGSTSLSGATDKTGKKRKKTEESV